MTGINYKMALFGVYHGEKLARQLGARIVATLYTTDSERIHSFLATPHAKVALETLSRAINSFGKNGARKQLEVSVDGDDAISVKPEISHAKGQRRHYTGELTTTPMGLVSTIEHKFAKAVVGGIQATSQEFFMKPEVVASGVVLSSAALEPGHHSFTMPLEDIKANAYDSVRLLVAAFDKYAQEKGLQVKVDKSQIKGFLSKALTELLEARAAYTVGFDMEAEIIGKKKIKQSDLLGAYGVGKEDIYTALVNNVNGQVERAIGETSVGELANVTTKRIRKEIED